MAPQTQKAIVVHEAGDPSVLKIEKSWPVTAPKPGQALIRVKAFGLNRSEMFTRQGHSPLSIVAFPRVLGIEAAGVVEECPGGELQPGDIVVTCMGGMGRVFDGGYAQYTCVPAKQVLRVRTELDWETLGALPEMLQTAYGSLFRSLQLKAGDKLLVRGGTTSVGLAAAAIAKHYGAVVTSTTRNSSRVSFLKEHGSDNVIIDNGSIAEEAKKVQPGGFDKILELVGGETLYDSLRCVKEGGIVCESGIVGNSWLLNGFNPIERIPVGSFLTVYGGGIEDLMRTPIDELAGLIKEGKMKIPIGKVYKMDEIVEAHEVMERNLAGGKIVVLTD